MAKEAFSFQMIARLAFLRAKVQVVHHFLIRLIFHFSYLGKMYLDFLQKASISITPPPWFSWLWNEKKFYEKKFPT